MTELKKKNAPVVVGLGNALVDVVAQVEPAAISSHKLTPGGMHLVDRAAADALFAEVGPGVRQSGGSVANSIAHLRGLGVPCAYVGKVADDELGSDFRADLARLDVAFPTAPLADGAGTGRCVVLVTPDGERTMSTYLGAAQALAPSDVEQAMPKQFGLLLVEGYLWDSPEGGAVIDAAAARAKAAGARIALTPSDQGCVQRNRAAMLGFIDTYCDALIGNRHEVAELAEADSPEKALRWASERVSIAAVTMSEDGALVTDGREAFHVDAAEVERVVDTTGAGDAFAAGFLGGLVTNLGVAEAGRLGANLAATVITHPGARQAPVAGAA